MSSHQHELSISFRSEANPRHLMDISAAAAKYDFDVMSVYEDLGDPSPMYPLFTLAASGTAAKLGPAGIAVPKYSSMEPIVGDITRLDAMTDGKAYLGLVPGAWMEQIGLKSASVQQMREAAEVSRYLLEKRDDGYQGSFYNVAEGFKVNYATPQHKIPLLIGAWGGKMAALAGEIADEVKVGGTANPMMIDIIKQRINVGAQEAGRDINDIGVVLGAVTVVDRDRQKALYEARRKAAVYIDVIGTKDVTAMRDFPEEIKAIKQAMSHGDVEEAVKHLPDELTKRFVFAGTPADIIRQTESIFENGATRVEYGTPHGIDEIEGIHLLGTEVLPYFKNSK